MAVDTGMVGGGDNTDVKGSAMGLSTAVNSNVVEASGTSGMPTDCEFDVVSFRTWSDNGGV